MNTTTTTETTMNETESTNRQIAQNALQLATMKGLHYGVEIETVGLDRAAACKAIAACLSGIYGVTLTVERDYCGGYDKHFVRIPDGRKWIAMTDGSLSMSVSAEVVTPILAWDEMTSVLQPVVRALRAAGAKTDDSCGIHVHVDAASFKAQPKALARLVKNVWKDEDLLFAMLQTSPARRARFCRPINPEFFKKVGSWDGRTLDGFNRIWYGYQNLTPAHYDATRYHALNLHAVWNHGTVEFRLFNGTLHAGKIRAYVQLALGLCARALVLSRASGHKRTFEPSRGRWDARIVLWMLGFVGDDFAAARKHLKDHLLGSETVSPSKQATEAAAA